LGVDPFVMIYNRKLDPVLRRFARWVNKRIYKVCKWEDYDPLYSFKKLKQQRLAV